MAKPGGRRKARVDEFAKAQRLAAKPQRLRLGAEAGQTGDGGGVIHGGHDIAGRSGQCDTPIVAQQCKAAVIRSETADVSQ